MSDDLITRLQRHVEQVDALAPSLEEMLTASGGNGARADGVATRGDDLKLGDRVELAQPIEIKGSVSRRMSMWTAGAVAAAAVALVMVGVFAVTGGNNSVVVSDVVSPPEVIEPAPLSDAVDPAPPLSIVDSLGHRWSRIPHDEEVFGVDSAGVDSVMTDVIAGGPGLVAVGTDGSHYDQNGFEESGALEFGDAAVWTSTDGITWSRVPHDEAVFGGAAMNSVTTGGPGLVAVGETISGAAVWTSVDGVTWSRVPNDEAVFAGADMTRVTVGGPGLVAVGPSFFEDGAQVWTSVDGLTWSRGPDEDEVFGGAGIRDITAGGPGLVAVGWFEDEAAGFVQRAAVWASVDGLTWSRVPNDEAMFGGGDEHHMEAVGVGGPGLVAVGWFANEDVYDQGTAVWTSVDGLSWSRMPYDEAVWGYGHVTSLVPVDSGLVAVGGDYFPGPPDRGGRVWTSPDGITWSRAPHESFFDNSKLTSVTVGGPGLVAVGDTFGADSDGVVWTAMLEN